MMDLLYICYDDRYRSKGLFDNIPTHAYDFKVKVTDLEIFNAIVFKSSYFPNHMMDWVYIWYDNIYRSKVISVIPLPMPQGQGYTHRNFKFKVCLELIFSKPYNGFALYLVG